MISQGTDGLSRGDTYERIMKGKTMIYFLPLEKSSLARSPDLSKWIEGWESTVGREAEVLELAGWFEFGHNHDEGEMNMDGVCILRFKAGTFVWSPVTAVTIIMI